MTQNLLANHTTARVGGPATTWITVTTEDQLTRAVADTDAAGVPLLVVAGGSNLLVADEGFPGTVVQISTEGVEIIESTDHNVHIRVAAGHQWDDVVAWSVTQGLTGIEALSGIPGSTGATPVQNVGAYGADISQTLHSIRVWDRENHEIVELTGEDLDFGYRDSIIKRSIASSATNFHQASPRWIVLTVDLQLTKTGELAPVRYTQLARALNVELGASAPLQHIRQTVLGLRASKGMVLDPTDYDTWSTGSFFTNPIVPNDVAATLPDEAPRFAHHEAGNDADTIKLSAAWLIDHAGFHKGFGLNGESGTVEGRASLSTKHTLALTNRGSATTRDLIRIASLVRNGVAEKWGIRLVPEPVLIGVQLTD
ncbi:UDP-N-acetylmuramate dehydrogenase [Enteractinococcus coprophilus]|uniref:UDP-N-acetylenolpyruvoylglucosamine reductase n=1 Tax=Enteractinococcus coprophilus TaxID=1027633 RepID=A0A542ZYK8_9MICC|nr:UDP-N-acetylmuramate dehydrogenase [Enteractinococcus coprophilus]TQL65447.1 UDP-N-acetylmuramate dehydrogenase [Enteractinococcus coprophilus]